MTLKHRLLREDTSWDSDPLNSKVYVRYLMLSKMAIYEATYQYRKGRIIPTPLNVLLRVEDWYEEHPLANHETVKKVIADLKKEVTDATQWKDVRQLLYTIENYMEYEPDVEVTMPEPVNPANP